MKVWIYVNGEQKGPYAVEELIENGVTPQTKIWFSGLPKWYPADMVPEVNHIFGESKQPEAASETAQPEATAETTQPPVAPPAFSVPVQAGQAPQPPVFREIQPSAVTAVVPCPPHHLVWSILLTVLCCSPFAIAAIITGSMVLTRYNAARYESAKHLSEATEWLIMISFALGTLPSLLMLALL